MPADKRKRIYFANLIQNTKELKLTIPWKRFGSQKDPLLYAKAEMGNFNFFADTSYLGEEVYYGFNCSIVPQNLQVLPLVYEEEEVFFDGGFYSSQKEGLKYYIKLQKILESYKIL